MRGLRAPELACSGGSGQEQESRLTTLFRDIASVQMGELLEKCAGLDEKSLAFVLADWEMGCSHMDAVLQQKLHLWSGSQWPCSPPSKPWWHACRFSRPHDPRDSVGRGGGVADCEPSPPCSATEADPTLESLWHCAPRCCPGPQNSTKMPTSVRRAEQGRSGR